MGSESIGEQSGAALHLTIMKTMPNEFKCGVAGRTCQTTSFFCFLRCSNTKTMMKAQINVPNQAWFKRAKFRTKTHAKEIPMDRTWDPLTFQ